MNLIVYECNRCGNCESSNKPPRCAVCNHLMTQQPSVDEIMLQMRYRSMVRNSQYPAAEAMAASIERVVKDER